MSALAFMAEGRRRRLFRKVPMGPFYIRFQFKGKDYSCCLGTTDEHAAKQKARAVIEARFRGEAEESRRLKVRGDYSPLSAICEFYRSRYGRDARTKRTAQTNIGALQKMVRLAGINVATARANVLTDELVRRFEAAETERIARDERGNMLQESELRVRTSIGSIVRQARSIFKQQTMNWFDCLALPDLAKFRRQGVTAPKRPLPRPLDDGVIESLQADTARLAREDPVCYVAFLLFSRCGMRNGEIKAARWGWITRAADGSGKIGVIYRPEEEYEPKARTEGWITLPRGTLAELDRYRAPSADGDFIVPAPNKTERAKIVDRRHSAWAGQWIKDRTKVSYELRRYAGSLIYKKTGKIEHVQKFLRHADLKTTTDWYWYLLEDTPGIEMEDFAPAGDTTKFSAGA